MLVGIREIETLIHCWWECRMVQLLWRTDGLVTTTCTISPGSWLTPKPALEALTTPVGVAVRGPHRTCKPALATCFAVRGATEWFFFLMIKKMLHIERADF